MFNSSLLYLNSHVCRHHLASFRDSVAQQLICPICLKLVCGVDKTGKNVRHLGVTCKTEKQEMKNKILHGSWNCFKL